jgi:hypothetical protein
MNKLKAWKYLSVVIAAVLVLGLAALAAPAAPVTAAADDWTIEVVDPASAFSTSLALDSQGNPHIAYTTGGLDSVHYASWTGSAWETEMVDDVPAVVVSLALDSDDNPHIAYNTAAFDSLHYAHWTGSSWAKEVVDTAAVSDCSLALDGQGRPHIAYCTIGGLDHLWYASLTSTGWEISPIDPASDIPQVCSLALDGNDSPHIASGSFGAPSVHYFHLGGGGWVDETVDGTPVFAVSIALDSYDNPHIAYATATLSSLHYASRSMAGWTTEVVDPSSVGDCSLAMDSRDRPHISYRIGGAAITAGQVQHDGIIFSALGILKYATKTDSTWDIEIVDQEQLTVHLVGAQTAFFGEDKWCSLALDADDSPHISYGNLIYNVVGTVHHAYIVAPPEPAPPPNPKYSPPAPNTNRYLSQANMSVQFVSVNPQQALASQPVTITTNVVNTGDAAGNYNVDLKINGQVEESRMVSVGPMASQPVKFTVTRDQPGTYTVDIVDKSSSFTILGDSTAGGTSGQNSLGLIVLALIGALIVAAVVVVLLRRA